MNKREKIFLRETVDEFRKTRGRALFVARMLPKDSEERAQQVKVARAHNRFVWRGEQLLSEKEDQ